MVEGGQKAIGLESRIDRERGVPPGDEKMRYSNPSESESISGFQSEGEALRRHNGAHTPYASIELRYSISSTHEHKTIRSPQFELETYDQVVQFSAQEVVEWLDRIQFYHLRSEDARSCIRTMILSYNISGKELITHGYNIGWCQRFWAPGPALDVFQSHQA
ncbi:hypothetical protein C7212DRAFT_342279 [Tuber magnatum]|uniref:Uncharacterized protein n=1 Tax=Tuber magnatum TaxID=42249 RepID=A0A317SVB5_9PEZI|nr:hypothetical protein C7212DRAFT_342279 [Tuber magnatum]